VVAWLLIALVTVVIALVGIRSLVLITSVRRGVQRAESVLRRADNAVERR
jgi:tellurite resistance protein